MEYWTVMWITVLSGALDGTTSGLVYPNLETCEGSIQEVTATLEYDYSVLCEESNLVSKAVRPKRRPEGLGNG